MSYKAHEQELDEGIRVEVVGDDCAENPIQCEYGDQAVQVSIWHRSYGFGNNSDFGTPEDFREFCRDQEEAGDPVFVLPVYLYDHSGLAVNTTGFFCPWDSGQVGFVWIKTSKAREDLGTVDPGKVEERFKGTVALLDDYLRGNVWGFKVLDREGEELDSCWGFYGDPDDALAEAMESAKYHVEVVKKARLEYENRRQQCFAI